MTAARPGRPRACPTWATTAISGLGLRVVHAVHGTSTSGEGVLGKSDTGTRVARTNWSATKPAFLGNSEGTGSGVLGCRGTATVHAAPAKTGVHGCAVQDATETGVRGQTTLGRGVVGIATTGHRVNGVATTGVGAIGYASTMTGAYGYATSGIGSRGYAATGTVLYASTSGPKVEVAFRAIGKVKLDNCAGVATIASGTNSIAVTPGMDPDATSAVVATVQGNTAGTTVKSVAVDATADTFTIYLTANATAAVKVAWHVFG